MLHKRKIQIFVEQNMFEIPITNLENVRVRNYLDPPPPTKSLFLPHPVFFPIYATNFSRNIHLTVLMMTETPQSQG